MDWRFATNTVKTVQIGATPRYVFAVVHGAYFTTSTNASYAGSGFLHNLTQLNLMILDTMSENPVFVPASRIWPEVQGMNLSRAAYNPERGYLLVAYASGRIQLIFDDGRVATLNEFHDISYPGNKSVNAISFSPDHKQAYLALTGAYICVDDENCEVDDIVTLWNNISYVGRVGDTLIAASNAKAANGEDEYTLFEYNLANGTPDCLTRFSNLEIENPEDLPAAMRYASGHLKRSDHIAPLTSGSFLTVGQTGASNATTAVVPLTLTRTSSGKWRAVVLADETYTAVPAASVVGSPLVGTLSATENGYAVKGSRFHFIRRGVNPSLSSTEDADYISKIYSSAAMPSGEELTPFGASYDKKTFWTCTACGASDLKGGFRMYTAGDNGSLSLTKSALIPNAPSTAFSTSIVYAPGYGSLVHNREYSLFFSAGQNHPDCTSLYDGNSWQTVGLAVSSPTLSANFVGTADLIADAERPNYFYQGSYNSGIIRLNLDDPSDVLRMVNASQYSASRSCDVLFMPQKTGQSQFLALTEDADGRYWTYLYENVSSYLPVYYWEKEDRLASVDKDSFKPWKMMSIPTLSNQNSNKSTLLACKNERNRNILIYSSGAYGSNIIVCDHNGTPADTSDDRVVTLTYPRDDDGRTVDWDYIYSLQEDPVTDRIFAFTGNGILWFDGQEVFDNPNVIHILQVSRVEGRQESATVGEGCMAMGYTVDSYGRKWIGFLGGGFVGLSADCSELLCSFDSANSPLINDDIYGLGWNPVNNSLLISTAKGMQEMTIYEGNNCNPAYTTVMPAEVTPGYKGYVTFSGLDDSIEYQLFSDSGEAVASLPRTSGGRTQWIPASSTGASLAPGIYSIRKDAASEPVASMTIVE